MKIVYLTIILNFIFLTNYGQEIRYIRNDTTKYYYSKTDFNDIDTLSEWSFKIDTVSIYETNQTKPIGKIYFFCLKPNSFYLPLSMTFFIYKITDSVYCRNKSKKIRLLSDYIPPNLGGDYIIIGDLILLNTDYCNIEMNDIRPMLNRIFSIIDENKIATINSLKSQLELYLKYEE